VPGDGPVLGLGGPFAEHDVGGDMALRFVPRPFPRLAQRATGAQAGDQFTLERAASLDVERLVDRPWLMRMSISSGKSRTSRREICSGLQAVAQRRSARCGLFSPFQVVGGPATTVPSGRCNCPLNRLCTYFRSRGLLASFAGLGRRAAVCAFHCATLAR
jgi:hypothetical protein